MTSPPTLSVREWSQTTPDSPTVGALLKGVRLSKMDLQLLEQLPGRSGIQLTELRTGLAISTGSYIGTINLSTLRLVIMPKLRIDNLMQMVAYAFNLSDLVVTNAHTTYATAEHGLIDLLGLSLLRAAERIARGGILPDYQHRHEDLATPRGRLDMRHIATHPRRATLRCNYDELTIDYALNQALAAGLRLAAKLMQSVDLRLDLERAADRLFGDLSRISLKADMLRAMLDRLDRRSSHYHSALTLMELIYLGAKLGDHAEAGQLPLSSFTLNMNMVFERFLERYLREHAPPDVTISSQDVRADVFRYLENGGKWRHPTIRPDLVFHQRQQVIAIADAKYKNRHDHPPSAAELYQLTTYGLAYAMPEPRQVLLLHPLAAGEQDRATTLQFAPLSTQQQVRIKLVGVPLDGILGGSVKRWWPLHS